MDLGLSRKELADKLGVKAKTVSFWELGLSHLSVKYLPAVIRFLGYDPTPEVTSLPQRLKAARRRLGISQRVLARRFGMDTKTIRDWELGRISRRTRRVERVLEDFVKSAEATE